MIYKGGKETLPLDFDFWFLTQISFTSRQRIKHKPTAPGPAVGFRLFDTLSSQSTKKPNKLTSWSTTRVERGWVPHWNAWGVILCNASTCNVPMQMIVRYPWIWKQESSVLRFLFPEKMDGFIHLHALRHPQNYLSLAKFIQILRGLWCFHPFCLAHSSWCKSSHFQNHERAIWKFAWFFWLRSLLSFSIHNKVTESNFINL